MDTPFSAERDVALSILKPSRRDLEYGLGLHRESVVVESYGLGFQAPLDAARLNANAGAGDDEWQDMVEGQGMTGWAFDAELRREYAQAWRAAGVTGIFQNAGEEGNDPLRLLKRLARYHFMNDAMPQLLRRVVTVDDFAAAHAEGRHCFCLTLNGVPLSGNHLNPEDELRYLPVFAQLGVKMMHLTYNRRNPIGDGCAEPANAGLSEFGREAVREMNRLGILIDLAHTGWQTCLDTARASDGPVVVSHSAAWALNPHLRCKPDEVIRAIVEKGGTIGVTNVPAFLGGEGTIADFLNHIDYVAKTFGIDAVTIGTDSGFKSGRREGSEAALQPRPRRRPRWEGLWPAGDPLFSDEWRQPRQTQSLAWTNWPLFTVGLVQRGYDDEAIRKIIGGNLLRVAGQVWSRSPVARALAAGE